MFRSLRWRDRICIGVCLWRSWPKHTYIHTHIQTRHICTMLVEIPYITRAIHMILLNTQHWRLYVSQTSAHLCNVELLTPAERLSEYSGTLCPRRRRRRRRRRRLKRRRRLTACVLATVRNIHERIVSDIYVLYIFVELARKSFAFVVVRVSCTQAEGHIDCLSSARVDVVVVRVAVVSRRCSWVVVYLSVGECVVFYFGTDINNSQAKPYDPTRSDNTNQHNFGSVLMSRRVLNTNDDRMEWCYWLDGYVAMGRIIIRRNWTRILISTSLVSTSFKTVCVLDLYAHTDVQCKTFREVVKCSTIHPCICLLISQVH